MSPFYSAEKAQFIQGKVSGKSSKVVKWKINIALKKISIVFKKVASGNDEAFIMHKAISEKLDIDFCCSCKVGLLIRLPLIL